MKLTRRGLLGAGICAWAATVGGKAFAEPPQDATSAPNYARKTLASMTLEQKVGQLLISQIYGADPTVADPRNTKLFGIDKGVDVVSALHLGGVMLNPWADSFTNGASALLKLTNALQETSSKTTSTHTGVPLLMCVQHEQGSSVRLGPPVTMLPSAMGLAATRRPADAREAAKITGEELLALGINCNLAPNTELVGKLTSPALGTRSFSSQPQLTADMAAAQVSGYQRDAHVVSCPLHFPGVEPAPTNDLTSHDAATGEGGTMERSASSWQDSARIPFAAVIDADADCVMVGHMGSMDPKDEKTPSSLSKSVIHDVLRDQMGFQGVIITDAIDSLKLGPTYQPEETVVRALQAGADMVLMPANPLAARDAILKAVKAGTISQRDLDAKVTRILRLKHRRGIVAKHHADAGVAAKTVNSDSHKKAATAITERSITLLRNDGTLPISISDKSVLVTGWGMTITQALADEFTKAGAAVTRMESGAAPNKARIDQVVAASQAVDLTVVVTMNVHAKSSQTAMVNRLVSSGAKVITVAVRSPDDTAYYSSRTAVATYSYSPVVAPALVRVLTGAAKPVGKLPVDVPATGKPVFTVGHGLTY